ncbi:hypothetical protein C8N37_102270 [Sphingobacterium faecium]|nr:hypothetical protein C8N37_102270 [Sphingobacterium faecium]
MIIFNMGILSVNNAQDFDRNISHMIINKLWKHSYLLLFNRCESVVNNKSGFHKIHHDLNMLCITLISYTKTGEKVSEQYDVKLTVSNYFNLCFTPSKVILTGLIWPFSSKVITSIHVSRSLAPVLPNGLR